MADEIAEGQPTLKGIPESTRGWWTSVLAGGDSTPHPIHGTDLLAKIDGDALVVSGKVPTEKDRSTVAAEVERLKGHGVAEVRLELEVVSEVTDEPGILSQTLVGIFENPELAAFARTFIEEHMQTRPQLLRIIDPAASGKARAEVQALLPEAYWKDAGKRLDEGRALLILTVDEAAAFKAREILDEETHSAEILILPPEAAKNVTSERRSLDRVDKRP
jgi:hypothetical protein